MPDGQGPVDIVGLAKTLAELGLVAVKGIKAVKGWGKGKEVEKLIKDIGKMQQKIGMLVGSLISYRMLNHYITQMYDETRDMSEKYYILKNQVLERNEISSVLRRDLDGAVRFYKQNLATFDRDTLDQFHASHIGDLLTRIGDLLSTACTNLENHNIDEFLKDNNILSKECCSVRGETWFAIDKLGEEFRKV